MTTTIDEASEGRRNLIFPPFQAHPAYTKKVCFRLIYPLITFCLDQ